jgi:XTP/dITP diphosphohydrolase
MDLIFATNNEHKLREIKLIIGEKVNLLSLKDINCVEDIPETGLTLDANASQKSHYIFNKYGKNCFADDTGLEIDVLNGEPGVYSARYAGEEKNSEKNMQKVLEKLKGKENRKARFRTVISLIIKGEEILFEGVVEGRITEKPAGTHGFGYDPIFVPDGFEQTFAELGDDVKNKISHRAKAVEKLAEYLKSM